jgi:integrase
MPRRSKGYTSGAVWMKTAWYGRLRIYRPGLKPKEYVRKGENKTHAKSLARDLEEKYIRGGRRAIDGDTMTFAELVQEFRRTELVSAVYDGEKKIKGYADPERLGCYLNHLVDRFGLMQLAKIQPRDLVDYKAYLIELPTRRGKRRSIYDVNHHLRALRLILNFAVLNRWIPYSPMSEIKNFINAAHELPRQRPEGEGELERLLAQCVGHRAHLRPWVILAIETSLRVSEIDRLTRQDILWEEGIIVAQTKNTKLNRRREVPLTPILAEELRTWFAFCETAEHWCELIPNRPDAQIFGGFLDNKKAFRHACRDAGIENLLRKDMRHWGTTRLVAALRKAGIPELHGMVITGHTRVATYMRYITTDRVTVQAARDALAALSAERDIRKIEPNSSPDHQPIIHPNDANSGILEHT